MDYFVSRLIILKNRIRKKLRDHIQKEKAYIKKLLFPLKLFPLKIIIYFFYYPIRIAKEIIIWSVKSLFKAIIWPFRKWSNLFKTTIGIVLFIYLLFSLIVILDYIKENYGHYSKFLCGYDLEKELETKVVRIVGGYSEGSGFFITEDQVLTSYHVIADEPSPKIILWDEYFITPTKITANAASDLAILYIAKKYPNLTLSFMDPLVLNKSEAVFAAGYALGTNLPGDATILRGRFSAFRQSNKYPEIYVQTDINLVPGMSGGPLVDRCGKVVGVNTSGLAGLSLFIASDSVMHMWPDFSEADIAKIEVDATTPEGAVAAFYTYLKARRMEDGFELLSEAYLQKTNFEEWTNRFRNVLDVQIYQTKMEDERNNTVFVKFSTSNWVNGEREEHFYEGTWETVLEDGVYKMNKSNIKEIYNPDWFWFYDI